MILFVNYTLIPIQTVIFLRWGKSIILLIPAVLLVFANKWPRFILILRSKFVKMVYFGFIFFFETILLILEVVLNLWHVHITLKSTIEFAIFKTNLFLCYRLVLIFVIKILLGALKFFEQLFQIGATFFSVSFSHIWHFFRLIFILVWFIVSFSICFHWLISIVCKRLKHFV